LINPGEIETLFLSIPAKHGLRKEKHMYICYEKSDKTKFVGCTHNPQKLVARGIIGTADFIEFSPDPSINPFKINTGVVLSETYEFSSVTFFKIPFKNCHSILPIILPCISASHVYSCDATTHIALNPTKLR
jgi:hypothetical protein